MLMQMVKSRKKEAWTMRMLRGYYHYHHKRYLEYRGHEEERVANISKVQEINERFSLDGLFFRDYDKEYHHKKLGYWCLFNN